MDPKLPIRSLDYTVIFARQMPAMREFYGKTLGFPLLKQMGSTWFEYRVGANILALRERGGAFNDPAPPVGDLSLQLAFRVEPAEVAIFTEAINQLETSGLLQTALDANGAIFGRLMRTHDFKEGVTAFGEKRQPEWTGR